MSDLRAEILKSVVSDLQSKVEAIMLEINILLSRPDGVPNLTEKLSELIVKLSIAESALNQASIFYVQTAGKSLKEQTIKAVTNDGVSDENKPKEE